jgi:tetratricopeptide (TPR) repeat protein
MGDRSLLGDGPSATDAWREAVARSRDDGGWEPDEVWVADDDSDVGTGDARATARRLAAGRAGRGGAPQQAVAPSDRHRRNVPRQVVDEIEGQVGTQRGAKLSGRLADATHAFDRERYQEARRILKPLADEMPESAAVQELYGLTLYRLGQWALATRHLELYRQRSGSTDQHPVLADCYRALHRYPVAEELWDELREASPSAELVAEGRIVAAGCRADQGDLTAAIAVLEKASKRVNHPADHHLRQWYALADLYERAGDLPRARELFGRVASFDPDAFDVTLRLRALR